MKPKFWIVCALFLLTGLVACIENRTVKVTCGPTKDEAISVDFGNPNVAGISIGLLDTHQFPPGTILQLSPPGCWGNVWERISSQGSKDRR